MNALYGVFIPCYISSLQVNEGKAQIHLSILKSSNGQELFIPMVSQDVTHALRMHPKYVLHEDSHYKS